MNYPREQVHAHQQHQAPTLATNHQQQQQQSTGIHQVDINAPSHIHTNPPIMTMSTSLSTTSLSSSSSPKSNKSKSNKSTSKDKSKSSKSNNKQSKTTTLATSEFESSPYHKKKQLQREPKGYKVHCDCDDNMIPSISKHRCKPSPCRDTLTSSNSSSSGCKNSSSSSSSRTISIEDKTRLQESLLFLPPLLPIEVVDLVNDDDNNNNNNTYNIDIPNPTGVLTARLSMMSSQDAVGEEMLESGYASATSEDEDISKYGYGDDIVPVAAAEQEQLQKQQQLQEEQKQEEYDDYGYGDGFEEEASISMNDDAFIADDEEADEVEDSADKYGYGDCENSEPSISTRGVEEEIALIDQLHSSQYAPINEYSSSAFCPNRMPRRSSMKDSSPSPSPSPESSSRSSSPSRRRRASADEDLLLAMPSIISHEDVLAMPSISSSNTTTTTRITENHIEVSLPGRPKHETVRRRRSITFDNDVDVQKIEPIKSLAGKDGSKSLWFQENEYETIKTKTLALLDRVDPTSGIIDGKKYCTRGLEKFMTPEATEVKKHQAWDSVLNEQFLQRKDGEYDEETLANIYKCSTRRSSTEASKRAVEDAVAAEAYLKTTFLRRKSYDKNGARFNRRCSM
ncbi:hypothetical protein FRACYDRAFT_246440 [Fragilariopsis cylindrus CCMP1102]|uniref:Uncharacterized protein n=1 Tax=Fragilariopsis cylindrus CCMP1102 TaxID=635003 RepID=A0A1E7EXU8_9STRA|nr:hypothetical protein FRACYDRAFT_246440 [Fragilariopsis cylindrus CCMP1102]|eukprot:OEU10687.1 hypothetical protein FRACYDRAFT_246440 [Fragilariopsis cylindrus CCMP1102]